MTSNYYNPTDPNLIYIQSRAEVDPALIEEYAEMMRAGVQFHAAKAIGEKDTLYIYDGYHRGQAAQKTGLPLLVSVKPGTRAEAEWLALAANQEHGLRRSNADKQKIVRLALAHDFGAKLSDRQLAAHCGVSHPTVARIREEMEATGKIYQSATRIGADGREINVGNIGKSTAENSPIGEKTEREKSIMCPNCDEVIFPDQDTKPNGAIVCDACKKRFPSYEALIKATERMEDYEGREEKSTAPAPAESCSSCGRPGRFDTYGTGRRICFQCWIRSPEHKAAAAPQATPTEDAAAPDTAAELRLQLGRALQVDSNRWAKHRQTGLSNAELMDAIGQVFGIEHVTTSGPGGGYNSKGLKNPRFWLGYHGSYDRPPTLAGAALRDAARELLGIPFPGEATEGGGEYNFTGMTTADLEAGLAAIERDGLPLDSPHARRLREELATRNAATQPPTPDTHYTLRSDLTYRCHRAGIRFGALLDKIKTVDQADRLDQALADLEKELAGRSAKISEVTR